MEMQTLIQFQIQYPEDIVHIGFLTYPERVYVTQAVGDFFHTGNFQPLPILYSLHVA
jgi:hypothetical protein